MKISKKELKRMIAEELNGSSVLLEMPQQMNMMDQTPDHDRDPDGYEGQMAKRSLYHMAAQAQQLHDIQVGPLVVTTDVVDLTRSTGFQNTGDAPHMILDVQPVPDIAAVTVYRNHTPIENSRQTQRNQLFGKMIGPVVVRAVTRGDLKAIGVLVGAHEMVAARFTG